MRSAIALATVAGVVVASPAPQAIDFDAIQAAPAPAFTQPPILSVEQTDVYNVASATVSAAAAVSSVASASATASVVPRGIQLEERTINWCKWFPMLSMCKTTTSATAAATSTGTTKAASSTGTATATTTGAAKGVINAAAAGITPSVSLLNGVAYAIVPTTCTPVSWTNTFEFVTTDTACPQPYETGTYCGFINPEDPCAAQPAGAGPQASPDTPAGFLNFAQFSQTAKSAVTPKGYAQTFVNYNASVSANSYLGLHTLDDYDVAGCAGWCDNTTLCTAFNIYIERDPSWNPDQCSCSTPTSITNYKCTLWGSGVEAASANNAGGWRRDFNVVIAGSNGYEKTNDTTPVVPDGFDTPQKCGNQTHDHASTCIGTKFFPGPYNPAVCASYALAQNAKNTNISAWKSFWYKITGYNPYKCSMINTYMIKQNGVAKGTHCKMFAQKYTPKYATYQPGWTSGKYWGCESSYTFNVKS